MIGAISMPAPRPHYAAMSGPELLEACRDDASKWAAAFCQMFGGYTVCAGKLDEGTMIGWFSNAIEAACDHRAREPNEVEVYLYGMKTEGEIRPYLTKVRLPASTEPPPVIQWRARMFLRRDDGGSMYFECRFAVAPQEEWR